MNAAIDQGFENVNPFECSLCVLSFSTRELLCRLLNPEKLIMSEYNLLRDWRGLAELIGISISSDERNPTAKVLQDWIVSTRENTPRPTIGVLLEFLGQIDRWDVYDDIKDKMVEDACKFWEKKNTAQALTSSDISERDVITIDDYANFMHGVPLLKYDAFFLYVDQDASFAKDIVSILEDDFGMRLCLRDRDLVGGLVFEHDAIMRLIENRCRQLIVIISEHYINSEEHKFFFKCTIEEIPLEVSRKVSLSPSIPELHTLVVPMSDPSAFLSPEKSKSDGEVSSDLGAASSKPVSKTSVSKPVSPAVKMRNMFRSKKSLPSETTLNENVLPKSKKGRSWMSSKKKVAIAES